MILYCISVNQAVQFLQAISEAQDYFFRGSFLQVFAVSSSFVSINRFELAVSAWRPQIPREHHAPSGSGFWSCASSPKNLDDLRPHVLPKHFQ